MYECLPNYIWSCMIWKKAVYSSGVIKSCSASVTCEYGIGLPFTGIEIKKWT